MLQCSSCLDYTLDPSHFPLCEICREAICSPSHKIQLSESLSLVALYTLTDHNVPHFRKWKTQGGHSWNSIFRTQIMSTLHDLSPVDAIIPIPQRFERRWSLKGGSSERFSRILSECLSVPIIPALALRDEAAPRKTHQSQLERMMTENAFQWSTDREQFENKRVLICDDFFTTGKTLLDAVQWIKQGRPTEIKLSVLAARRSHDHLLQALHRAPSQQQSESLGSTQIHRRVEE